MEISKKKNGSGPIGSGGKLNLNFGVNCANISPKELKPDNILIIDAADFKAKPGEVRIIDKEAIPDTTLSTHTISLRFKFTTVRV